MGIADEGDEIRSSRMDLNLNPAPRYLQSSDFESNLALSSPTTEENRSSLDMPNDLELANSHASFTREPTNPPIDHNASIDGNFNQERTPPSIDHPSPTIHENPPSYTPSYDTQSPSDDSLDPQETDDETVHPLPLRTLSPLFTPDGSSTPPDVSMLSPLEMVHQLFAPNSASWSGSDESPTYRFHRLIESSNRYRGLRRSLSYHGSQRSNFGRSNSPDIRNSQRTLESNGKKHKVQAEGIEMESSEEEKEEKSNNAANFECNICFDMAQEPVVTSCGHLFCWSCLYQWLHIHSECKMCPVCKGEVIESNITPIYGRGSSEPSGAENFAESGDSNIKIPPRPRGNRFENSRQQSRPISRRFRYNRNRFEGHGVYHAAFTRLRERILLREESNTEFDLRDSSTISQGGDANPLFSDGIDFWDRLRDSTIIPPSSDTNTYSNYELGDWRRFQADRTERLQSSDINPSIRDGLDDWRRFQADRTELRYQTSINGGLYHGNRYEASTSSVNPSNLDQLFPGANVALDSTSDQVSVSSTMAMIQGDVGHPEGSSEPNSARSG